ncbi:unnamed protein product [Nezara viridula]|uniref:MOSC domain-containing protein n=1 Tax=Nezara viridula TaxID=85310 RepID=A0A9P0E3W2_NEZVI|nr:unnamed protein product [Nezara viridula]
MRCQPIVLYHCFSSSEQPLPRSMNLQNNGLASHWTLRQPNQKFLNPSRNLKDKTQKIQKRSISHLNPELEDPTAWPTNWYSVKQSKNSVVSHCRDKNRMLEFPRLAEHERWRRGRHLLPLAELLLPHHNLKKKERKLHVLRTVLERRCGEEYEVENKPTTPSIISGLTFRGVLSQSLQRHKKTDPSCFESQIQTFILAQQRSELEFMVIRWQTGVETDSYLARPQKAGIQIHYGDGEAQLSLFNFHSLDKLRQAVRWNW